MTPDATQHDPRPEYLRALVERAGITQRETARRIGISDRLLRHYLHGSREAPYPVQYAMERLAASSEFSDTASGRAGVASPRQGHSKEM